MDNKTMKMPAVALRGMVILPGMIAHFDVSRDKSIHAVEQSMMDEQKIFLVAQRDVEQEEPGIEDLYQIGIIAEVKQVIKLQNNIVRVLVEGTERAQLSAFVSQTDFLEVELVRCEEVDEGLSDEAKRLWCAVCRTHLKNMCLSTSVSAVNCADRSEKKRICQRLWI